LRRICENATLSYGDIFLGETKWSEETRVNFVRRNPCEESIVSRPSQGKPWAKSSWVSPEEFLGRHKQMPSE
jgi:hypothetical protein